MPPQSQWDLKSILYTIYMTCIQIEGRSSNDRCGELSLTRAQAGETCVDKADLGIHCPHFVPCRPLAATGSRRLECIRR